MKNIKSIVIIALSLLSAILILIQFDTVKVVWKMQNTSHHEQPYVWPTDEAVSQKLQQWQDWKFGVIIHWGPYSQWGIVESWSLCPEDEPWCERRGEFAHDYNIYVKEYEKIRTVFNPVDFDPHKWAKACNDAGMKYVVFTTKHHDGFCMFDSKFTDYKITDSGSVFSQNPRSNITKEVFNAFRTKGMGVGVYFSKADWHNHDYWWPYFPVFDRNVNYNPEKYPEKWEKFKEFTYNQIEELMTNYGDVDILWLDGGWVRPEGTLTEETIPWLGKNQWIQDINMPAIANMSRKHQPGLLIVDRTVHGEFENYRTPEQQIPNKVLSYPWESCITLGDSWYSTGPKERYKSATWAIHTLVNIVARGGNFLLGIGPDNTGAMVPEVYERLEEIGKWMKVNGEAIYNTTPLKPYKADNYCFTISNDKKSKYLIYLIEEGKGIQKQINIPRNLITQKSEVKLLGYTGMLKILEEKNTYSVIIPHEYFIDFENTPALVLSFPN
jgi:alpha-L-fucosidase